MKPITLIATAVSLVIISAIGAGLYLLGSPTDWRTYRIDQERVSDLRQLSYAIQRYQRANDSLPLSLDAVDQDQYRDPETKAPYEYERVDDTTFRVCGTFAESSRINNEDNRWYHPAGRHCFKFPR
ncbi:MAG: hypothetical protein AAF578_11625 [Pseudomonadota bacterium]